MTFDSICLANENRLKLARQVYRQTKPLGSDSCARQSRNTALLTRRNRFLNVRSVSAHLALTSVTLYEAHLRLAILLEEALTQFFACPVLSCKLRLAPCFK
jgi:hypothetical protein